MTTTYQSYLWYIKTDLSAYAGKWITIIGKKIIASGEDPQIVLEETKAKTKKTPLLAKIPRPGLRICVPHYVHSHKPSLNEDD